MTNKDPMQLVELARSWNYPPDLKLLSDGYTTTGYDNTERAYKLHASGIEDLIFEWKACEEQPLINPALVIENWPGDTAFLSINDKEIPRGKEYRYGIEYQIDGTKTLVCWLKLNSKKNVTVKLMPK